VKSGSWGGLPIFIYSLPFKDLYAASAIRRGSRGSGHESSKIELEFFSGVVRVKPSLAIMLHRDEIRRLVGQSRTRNPRVFGSVLRGKDTDRSDLDILVDPLPGATLFDLGGLQIALEDLLGIRVDLLTPGDLPRRSCDRVLREAVPV
jgi:predicted nucleotidyltransferase